MDVKPTAVPASTGTDMAKQTSNTNPFIQSSSSCQSEPGVILRKKPDENKKIEVKDSGNEMSLDAFLIHFLRNHRDDNFLSIKHGNYTVTSEEAIGEIVDWTMQYLEYM